MTIKPMTLKDIDYSERQIAEKTLQQHRETVGLLDDSLKLYLDALPFLERHKFAKNAEYNTFLYIAHAFNTLKCTRALLLKGYYAQALCLIRTVEDDWSGCQYLKEYPGEAAKWYEGKPPKAGYMRQRLQSEHPQLKLALENAREFAKLFDLFAHGSPEALETITVDEGTLRVGGNYDDKQLTAATYCVLVWVGLMLGVVHAFVEDSSWRSCYSDLLKRIENWMEDWHRLMLMVTVRPGEDGYFVVECPAIPGCVSQGKTEQEALANIEEAIRLCLEVRRERNLPISPLGMEVA